MPYLLRVLGPPEVLDEGGKPVSLSLGKPLALLIYVASNPSPVSRDELADLFWPDADRQKGRHSVRQALWVLKNALGEEIIETDDPISISQNKLEVDLHVFLTALSDGRVDDARALWTGPVLEHFRLAGARGWNRWVEDLRSDLERRFSTALLLHARELASEDEPDKALSALDQAIVVAPAAQAPHLSRINLLLDLLRLDPAREALADAHHTLGDRDDALGQLAALEARLDRVALEQRIQVGQGDTFPMEFVGRSREMAALHGLWREAFQGRPRVAVISGPSGIGKSRLAQEVLAHLSGEDTEKVSIRGTRGERKLRWGGASDLVRQLLRLPGSAAISTASDSLLRAMLPSMGREPTTPQPTNGINPAAVLDAAMDLLESVSFETPLAVLVDDLQWVDPESRTVLVGLANRSRESQVLFLFLGRSDLSSRYWEDLERSLVADADARRFVLDPLIEEEVGELLALSAAFQDSEDAAKVVSRIHRSSAGNPLFIREILEELHDQGALRREEAGWVFEASALSDEFELPENIRNLLKERMDRLSEAGATVAATLARESRSLSAEALRTQTQLPTNVFTQAIAELLERGVVEWTDGTRLDFVHDLLREAAATHLNAALPQDAEGTKRRSGTRALLLLAAGILLALPMGILWGNRSFPWQGDGSPPPYGGGEIIISRSDRSSPLMRVVASSRPSEWTIVGSIQRPSEKAVRFFPGPDGNLVWFGILTDPLGPDMIQVLPDGSERLLFPGPGDQSLRDLSRDGSRILFLSQNMEHGLFSQSLYRGWLESGATDLLYKGQDGQGPLGDALWSPNGDLISLIAPGPEDTLIVMARDGDRVGSVTLGNTYGFTWCGSQLVASTWREDEGSLIRVQIPEMVLDTLAEVVPGARPSCSPDGTALVYMGVVNRHLVPLLMDLGTAAIEPLDFLPGGIEHFSWLRRSPNPVPLQLVIDRDIVRLSLGEGIDLPVSLLMSDGSRSKEGIELRSLNPRVAVPEDTGEVTGTGPGRTSIVAEWGFSLRDTVVVEVAADEGEGPTFRDPFHTLDTTRWIPMGAAPRITTTETGERILQIQGQEKYSDGLILASPVFLDQGLTVELEFKATLGRKVHENISICLLAGNPTSVPDRKSIAAPASTCIHYPAHELSKFDPSAAYIMISPGRIRTVRVPEILPADDWVHMALQVRADGEATLVLDGQRVATNPVLLQTQPGQEWTLVLQGDAVMSEIFVRNLAVWPGERY